MALLEVNGLETQFYTEDGIVRAVDEISYEIDRGEKFGIVGESGAGKSVTSLSIMQLIESPGEIVGGSIKFRLPERVEAFANDYPDRTVDLEAVRNEFDPASIDPEPILETLESTGSIDQLTRQELFPTAPPEVIAEEPSIEELRAEYSIDVDRFLRERIGSADDGSAGLDIVDIIDAGYGEPLGLIDEDDFVFVDAGTGGYIELTRAPQKAMRRLRGNNIAMVFQDAETALNPVYTVGEQISEGIRVHEDVTDGEAKQRAIEMLEKVGIPDPAERYSDHPHQFSGGMQQRAVIAIALSCDPDLLVCDEPTTALDVTIEAQILELLEELADEFDTAIQLITHDLGVVAEICDRVMVMYAGQAVEKAPVEELYYDPKHPYTVGLMGAIPRIGDERDRLETIPGTMPDLVDVPPGCSFHPRCPFAEEACSQKEPPLVDVDERDDTDHVASCLSYTGDLRNELGYTVEVMGETHE